VKSPAILFYTSDFLTGVSSLTMEERGQYITLLCLQHQLGRLSKKVIEINVPNVGEDVLTKFVVDDEGNYYNERMEEETAKRNKYVDSRYKNGYKGGRPVGSKKQATKDKEWNEMLDFFENKCLMCGSQFEKPDRPTKDHVVPQSWGGTDDISNLQPLCRECNSSKCADSDKDYRTKYIDKVPEKLKEKWFNKNLMVKLKEPYGSNNNNHIENENENDNVNGNDNNKGKELFDYNWLGGEDE